jgi:hypothetical protein
MLKGDASGAGVSRGCSRAGAGSEGRGERRALEGSLAVQRGSARLKVEPQGEVLKPGNITPEASDRGPSSIVVWGSSRN